MATVTPWDVTGKIDYEKLIRQFGVEALDAKLLTRMEKHAAAKGMVLHHLLRRGIFFAHRDLAWLLNGHDHGKPWFLYTGRAPSGHTHLGHLVPWLLTKWLQDVYDVDLYFQFPDEEKYLFKENLTLEDVAKYMQENMLDVIALGFKPSKTHFIIDTRHAGVMYREALKVAKRITYSTAKAAFGFTNEQNIGAIFYTAMQAVPAFLPSVLRAETMACLIPHAIDQDPHFRVSRDVITKIGYPKPASIQCRFLPPLSGTEGKMGTSTMDAAMNTIFTTDSPATVKKKINKYAYSGGQATIEEHRRKGGDPDIDVSFEYLRHFMEDDEELERIRTAYSSGEMLTGELKKITIETINTFLAEHQKRREAARAQVERFVLKT